MSHKQTLETDSSAVSPVIGVILMVAITVILAAVVAAFVLDLAQATGANASAGISFSDSSSDQEVRVTITSVDRADRIEVRCGGSDEHEFDSPRAGDSATISYDGTACADNPIQVIGIHQGNGAVLATYSNHL